jgi:hypothetical protein
MLVLVRVEPGLTAINGIVSVGIAMAIFTGKRYFLVTTTVTH